MLLMILKYDPQLSHYKVYTVYINAQVIKYLSKYRGKVMNKEWVIEINRLTTAKKEQVWKLWVGVANEN